MKSGFPGFVHFTKNQKRLGRFEEKRHGAAKLFLVVFIIGENVFKISQAEGNEHGTKIENTAFIYFDFNPPIHTNTVLQKVGQIFPWTFVGTEMPIFENLQVRIMPNPLTDSTLLQLDNAEPGLLRLLLVKPSGQVVRDEKAFGTAFEIQRGDLPSGIYFFKITRDGLYVGSGKLMVQ